MRIEVPEASDLLTKIGGVTSALHGSRQTVDTWRSKYRESVRSSRQREPISVFGSFVGAGLLERTMSGEAYERRAEKFPQLFQSFDDVTEARVKQFLSETGYRFPASGLSVVMDAKRVVTAAGFSWQRYFEYADEQYENDFENDAFLDIKYVAFKTRDLALSEFSDRFVAVDLHVARVTVRTGLLLHGYGDPDLSTNQQDKKGYRFLHDLLLKLSRSTGWPAGGYSPGEVDRVFWHFGRSVCRATPRCRSCPLKDTCVTAISPGQRI